MQVDSASAVQTALAAETSWYLVSGSVPHQHEVRKAYAEARKSRRCGRRGVQRKRRCKPHLRKLGQGGARRKRIRREARDWRLCSPAWSRCPCRSSPRSPDPSLSTGQKDSPVSSIPPPRRIRNLLIHLHDVSNHLAPPTTRLIFVS